MWQLNGVLFIIENILIVVSLNLKCIKLVKQCKLILRHFYQVRFVGKETEKNLFKINTGDCAVTNAII